MHNHLTPFSFGCEKCQEILQNSTDIFEGKQFGWE